jgi:hypothetical protein
MRISPRSIQGFLAGLGGKSEVARAHGFHGYSHRVHMPVLALVTRGLVGLRGKVPTNA